LDGVVPTTHLTSVVGWREWVSMPELGVDWIKAKLDTGARTSALHAFDLEEFERDGQAWVRFSVHPWQRNAQDAVVAELPVHDVRTVRSSSGHVQERYVVMIAIRIGTRRIRTEVTLTRRDEMGFRLLVGREALRQGFVVDSSHSYLGGRPKRVVRRRNRGKHEDD
jgi:hypothetical protein